MAQRISRRVLAQHVAKRLTDGETGVIEQLAGYLVASKRTAEVDLLVRDIEFSLSRVGVVIADVVSARTLTAVLQRSIVAYVKDASDAKDVHIRTRSDETLVGGVRITTPGAEYDATIQGKLAKLQAMKV